MSASDQSESKQYEASPLKLARAREQGEIVRSADVLTAASFLGVFLAILLGGASLVELSSFLQSFFDAAVLYTVPSKNALGVEVAGRVIQETASKVWAFFVIPMVLVLMSLVAMRGIVFAGPKIAPKLSRISLVQNAKNKFGKRGFFEFFKSFFKLFLISLLFFLIGLNEIGSLHEFMYYEHRQFFVVLWSVVWKFFSSVFAVLLFFGVVDYLWQRHDFLESQRMSYSEFKQEFKESEGDPHFKMKRRQMGRELAFRSITKQVSEADVVIVNPTHFAVVLKWERARGGAPHCVAKGVDKLAAKIREIANEHRIPIYSDPPTARALYQCMKIGDEVEPEYYKAVAAAIRFSEQMAKT